MTPNHDLKADSVIKYMSSARAGRRNGATMTVVNEATGNRLTVRFRRPNDKDGNPFKQVMVDLMTGSDNESSFAYIGTFDGSVVRISNKQKTSLQKAQLAGDVLNWTLRAARAGDLKTVRCLHEGRCGRCGRKLTVPESIDTGLGPECAGK